jgi:hypothetical protein
LVSVAGEGRPGAPLRGPTVVVVPRHGDVGNVDQARPDKFKSQSLAVH